MFNKKYAHIEYEFRKGVHKIMEKRSFSFEKRTQKINIFEILELFKENKTQIKAPQCSFGG
jgi:hypothetical protein